MGRTVAELLDSIDAAELQEWFVYHQIDPWGEERADLRAGMIASTLANCHSVKRRFKPSDFMPRYELPRKRTPGDLKSIAQRWNAVFGGKASYSWPSISQR